MNKYKYETIDFGYIPNTEHYYILDYLRSENTEHWMLKEIFCEECVEVNAIQTDVFEYKKSFRTMLVKELNDRLKKEKLKQGKLNDKHNRVKLDKILGKEVELLFWGMQTFGSNSNYKTIFDNWVKLLPSERWWLHYHLKRINKKLLAVELFN